MKAPILEKLRKDSESSLSRRLSKKLSSNESLADVKTTECSPMVNYESLRKSKISKLSNHITKTVLNPEEYDNCRAYNFSRENSRFRSFQIGSSSKSIEDVHDGYNKKISEHRLKIFYMIPEKILSINEKSELLSISKEEISRKEKEQSVTFKNGFVIRSISIQINPEKTVEDIQNDVIEKINSNFQLHGFDYRMVITDCGFTFRSSKKSGFPDFDLPGKFINNQL